MFVGKLTQQFGMKMVPKGKMDSKGGSSKV